MRDASMRPVSGPASSDTLAAGGGLELPGRERNSPLAMMPDVNRQRDGYELIPGAREPDTLTRREPGAIGGRFNGADLRADAGESLDERTAAEHAREGGGGNLDLARERNDSHQGETDHE
jgi:hypothetical protein